MEISIQVNKGEAEDVVHYIGPINEDSEVHFAGLLEQLGSKVIFNFRQVEYINSCGVRAWIHFLREAEQGREIIFEECTPEIVSQINMIPNFKGSAKIGSVYASFTCEDCDASRWQIFKDGESLPTSSENIEMPPVKCEVCGSEMEMEELEEEFFGWLDV